MTKAQEEWAAYSWVNMLRVPLRATLCSIRKCHFRSISSHVIRVNVVTIGINKTSISKDIKIVLHLSWRRKSLLVLLKRSSTRVYQDEEYSAVFYYTKSCLRQLSLATAFLTLRLHSVCGH